MKKKAVVVKAATTSAPTVPDDLDDVVVSDIDDETEAGPSQPALSSQPVGAARKRRIAMDSDSE